VPSLRDVFSRARDRATLERELDGARRELARLRDENERMRTAMRRCLTCDYRLAARNDPRSNPPGSGEDEPFHGGPR